MGRGDGNSGALGGVTGKGAVTDALLPSTGEQTMMVSYTHELPMGHRLQRHEGKCRFLHGHNYQVKVTVDGPIDDQTGMVIDFHDLKEAVRKALDFYDHAFVLEHGDNVLREVDHSKQRIIYIDRAPTAENLATVWAGEIHGFLHAANHNVKKVWVGVRETRDCQVDA